MEDSKEIEEELDNYCTNSLLLDKKVKQIPFYYKGSYYCEPCSRVCMQIRGEEWQKQAQYYWEFKC